MNNEHNSFDLGTPEVKGYKTTNANTTNPMTYKTSKKIVEIYEDYGLLHEKGCELNDEDGSFDGCTCAIKEMAQEIIHQIRKEDREALRKWANKNKQNEGIYAWISLDTILAHLDTLEK